MDTKHVTRRKFIASSAAAMGTFAAADLFAQGQAGAKSGSGKVLHVIGYSHVDAAWLWPWRDSSNLALTTARSALDRITETEGFKYCASSMSHYRWIQKADPAMFQEILHRIREGRWATSVRPKLAAGDDAIVPEHLAKWADFLYLAVIPDVSRRPQEGGLGACDGALAAAVERRQMMSEGWVLPPTSWQAKAQGGLSPPV